MRLKPFFGYFGSKWRLASKYPEPRYPLIIEPFAGSAGYSLLHYEHKVLLNDLNTDIYAIWKLLLSAEPRDIRYLPESPLAMAPDAAALAGFWMSKAPQSPRTVMTPWAAKYPGSSWWGPRIRERIASQLQYIRHWQVKGEDYSNLPDIEATWFVDPPYKKFGNIYPTGARGIDFEHLAAWCKSRKGQVIVCEGSHGDWLPFRTLTEGKRVTGAKSGTGSKEVVWVQG